MLRSDKTATWTNCVGERTYVDESRDSRGSAHGIQTYPSGDKYVGEWRNGLSNGKAISTAPTDQSCDQELPAMYVDKNFVNPEASCPMGQTTLICSGAPLFMWTKF